MSVAKKVTVTRRGPVFDGRAAKEVAAGVDEATAAVAQRGLDLTQQRLGQVLKHPTGRYRSRVAVERARSGDSLVITDGGVVYGAWLEGTSRRNQRSRFKGYRTFRYVLQQLRGDAVKVAAPVVERRVTKAGGR